MDIVVANGFSMERCTFFSREYHCCVLHNTRCKCEDYNPRNSKPITNADKLRSMTDEDLAVEATVHGGCPHGCETPDDMDTDCVKCWLNWLQKEADDGTGKK